MHTDKKKARQWVEMRVFNLSSELLKLIEDNDVN